MFLQEKSTTQTVKGGNEELYANGTLEKSNMLVREHPDVSKLTRKYGRWHHHVDYKKFQQPLVRKMSKENINKTVSFTDTYKAAA